MSDNKNSENDQNKTPSLDDVVDALIKANREKQNRINQRENN